MTDAMGGRPAVVMVAHWPEGGLARSVRRGFEQQGWDVVPVDMAYGGPRLVSSVAIRLPSLAGPIRRSLRGRIDEVDPDAAIRLVLVVKGDFVDPPMIDRLRSRFGAPVVCWNPDSPFADTISNRGGDIRRSIPAYDAYVTWAPDLAEQLQRLQPATIVIPFGWDPQEHQPNQTATAAADRIVFVGTWDPDRASTMRAIASTAPLVFGSDWPPVDGVEVNPPVTGPALCAAITQARWNINVLRPQNRLSHNMRTFEVAGIGGNVAAQWTPQHEEWLSPFGVELFTTLDELRAILVSAPDVDRESMRRWAAQQTYAHRVDELTDRLHLARDQA